MGIEFSINAKRIESEEEAKIEVKIHDLTRGDLVGAFAEIFKAQPDLRDIALNAIMLVAASDAFKVFKNDDNDDDDDDDEDEGEEGEEAPPQ